MSVPDKFNKFTEVLITGNIYPYLKSADKFLSKNFFDKDDFDENAWYYNKDKVFDFLMKNIPTSCNKAWYEEDELKVVLAYFEFLCNYDTFVLFVIIFYFWFLLGLLFLAYWLFYVPLLF